MNLVRFDPWSIVNLMQRDFDRLATRAWLPDGHGSDGADWTPAVDVVEEKERFVLRADVPGVVADDIEISMEDGTLSIAGKRHAESHDDVDGVKRFERVAGRFYRRFALPETADAEGITAKTTNGILEVVIPKLPEVQARRITVEAA